MRNKRAPTIRRNFSSRKIVSLVTFAVGVLAFTCILIFLLFLDPIVNKFVKPRIIEAFVKAYPAYSIHLADMHYNIIKNRFGFDSVAVSTEDGNLASRIGPFFVSGIAWRHILWGEELGTKDFANVTLEMQDIGLNIADSRYRFHCERLHISVPDSEIAAELIELRPLAGDHEFFGSSKFRKTRLSFFTPQCRITGLAWIDLLEGKIYRARSIQIREGFLDVLVNKDKPNRKETSSPQMPHELLASIKEPLFVESLNIINGRFKYNERFTDNPRQSRITFDSVQIVAKGITNQSDLGSAILIRAQTKFANAGTMIVNMSIPVASPKFSFHYSGSLSTMELSALNSFLEPAEHMRIKSGVLQEVTFEINVVLGYAKGNVRGIYRNLSLAAIDKYTGSEKGFSNGLTSFIANSFKIHGTNVPDKLGNVKLGVINYKRDHDDSFIRYIWFALRTGVRDIAGF